MNRLWGAFTADPKTYYEIQADKSATFIALLVVVTARVADWVGSQITTSLGIEFFGVNRSPLYETIPLSLISWLGAGALFVVLSSRLFGANMPYQQMLRITGFAQVALFVTVIPVVGSLAGIWALWVLYRVLQMRLNISGGQAFSLLIALLVVNVTLGLLGAAAF